MLGLMGTLAGCAGTPGMLGTSTSQASTSQAHTMSPDDMHNYVFVHNFVMNTTCQLSTTDMWKQMLNTTCLRLAAREWSATHDIQDWRNTPFSHTLATEPEIWHYMQLYNIPATVIKSHMQYVKAVYLPGVLSVFMAVNVKLRINKYVYMTLDDRPTMHTVTLVLGIQLIGSCVLYT